MFLNTLPPKVRCAVVISSLYIITLSVLSIGALWVLTSNQIYFLDATSGTLVYDDEIVDNPGFITIADARLQITTSAARWLMGLAVVGIILVSALILGAILYCGGY